MILSHIVAAAKNNVIGVENGLPWDIPEDMKFFREKTKGKIIIMGRKTFESVGHPLPHRLNLVVTRQKDYEADGGHVFSSLKEALEFAKTKVKEYDSEVFIIGGGQIYKESLDSVDRVYLTRIHQDFEGSTTYPVLDPNQFHLKENRDRTDGPTPFSFLIYERTKKKA